MKKYVILVKSPDFKKPYTVMANNVSEAAHKAKLQFYKEFNRVGYDVVAQLDNSDVVNHIEEILYTIASVIRNDNNK